MQRSRGLRLPDACGAVTLLCVAVFLGVLGVVGRAVAQDVPAAPALADSVCQRLVDAFESLEPVALRAVLSASEIQVAVAKGRSGPRVDDRKMSAEQAIVFLREALGAEPRAIVGGLAPGAIVAAGETVGCRCPEIGASGDDAFLVLHFGAREGDRRTRRLYLDLRRDGTGWRIRAVREVV